MEVGEQGIDRLEGVGGKSVCMGGGGRGQGASLVGGVRPRTSNSHGYIC